MTHPRDQELFAFFCDNPECKSYKCNLGWAVAEAVDISDFSCYWCSGVVRMTFIGYGPIVAFDEDDEE